MKTGDHRLADTCPSQEDLVAFHSGKLSLTTLETVVQHLDTCPECSSLLEKLDDSADPLVSELRRPTESWDETESQRAVALVEKIGLEWSQQADRPPDQVGAAAEPAQLGQLGQYQLLQKLGEGGMGQVFKARHQLMNRIVALKVIHQRHLDTPAAVRRFQREIRALARLDHANIVRAHDADQIGATHFLVMEYVEGTNLAELVRKEGPLPVAQACAYLQQAAAGLQHAHEHGLVHRDIKPSNLILTSAGQVKVLDLGLARFREDQPVTEEVTAAGQVMGTFDYMAPEQWEETRAVDIRADIYGLGCTLYYLLTDKPPFSGPEYNSALKKMKAHAEAPIPPIRDLRPDVPDDLAAVLKRMLAKDPAERYATPAEVSAALQPFTTLPPGETERSTGTWPAGSAAPTAAQPTPATAGSRFRRAWRRACRKRPILNRVRLGMALATLSVLIVAGVSMKLVVDRVQTKGEQAADSRTLALAKGQAGFPEPSAETEPNPTAQFFHEESVKGRASHAKKVRIRRMRIGHYRGEPPQPLGDIGVTSFATQVEDDVKVHAELTGPGYCYLIAYNPDGKEQLCYPTDEKTPPAPLDVLDYPPEPSKYFGLTKREGPGPQAFVLLASGTPLPVYKEWRERHGLAPWQPGLSQGVWRFDGQWPPMELYGERGEVRERKPVTKSALDFFNFFKDRTDVDAVKILVFPVKAKEEKKGAAKPREKS